MARSRRAYLRLLAASGLTQTAGCHSGGKPARARADIIAGPDGQLVFTTDQHELSAGETVQWYFASAGHNLSCRPAASDLVALPASAEPFSTYDPDASHRTIVPRGDTYSRAFEVPGTYRYVCIPHAAAGMTGELIVTD